MNYKVLMLTYHGTGHEMTIGAEGMYSIREVYWTASLPTDFVIGTMDKVNIYDLFDHLEQP